MPEILITFSVLIKVQGRHSLDIVWGPTSGSHTEASEYKREPGAGVAGGESALQTAAAACAKAWTPDGLRGYEGFLRFSTSGEGECWTRGWAWLHP